MGYVSSKSLFAPGELPRILLSASVLGLAFTIATRGGVLTFAFSLATVGIGFVGHELAHKFMAMRFGYYASYQIWPTGFAIPLPAISRAEPWTGSNMEGFFRSGSRLIEGAIPMHPAMAPPRSVRMSPKRLLATTTPKC